MQLPMSKKVTEQCLLTTAYQSTTKNHLIFMRCGIDYQIVGFDNLAGCMKLPFHYPEITSIDYPRESAAQAAARLLISLIVKKSSICYQILKFPTKLTIRESAFSEHAGVF